MATIKQAIEWLRKGNKVRRPCWKEDSYWTLGTDEIIMWGNCDKKATIHLNQLEANDWELVKTDLSLSHDDVKNFIAQLEMLSGMNRKISPKKLIAYLQE